MRSNRYPDRAHGAFFFVASKILDKFHPPPISDELTWPIISMHGDTRLTFSRVMPADASVCAEGPISPLTLQILSTIGT